MSRNSILRLRFWGVRGSTPAPQPGNVGYGGNTACLEVQSGEDPPVIFDAGTGIRGLGLALSKRLSADPSPISLFLTHFHWDHIQGIPFFAPLYSPSSQLRFHSVRPPEEISAILERQMENPYFSARAAVRADLHYVQLQPDGIRLGEVLVKPVPLCHPGGAAGYRIDAPHGSIVYASDHEHGNQAIDRGLRNLARGADILIYDAQFTPEEHAQQKGWGHSTWIEATKVALDAGVRQLVLFHHDPQHDDQSVANIVEQAREEFENTIGAKEGWTASV